MQEIIFGQNPDDGVGVGIKEPIGRTWKKQVMKEGEKLVKADEEG